MKSINKKYFSIRSIYLLIIDLPQVDRYEMRDIIYYELDIIIWQPGHHTGFHSPLKDRWSCLTENILPH